MPGPSGQMIPNTDLVTTQVLPGANRQVVYTLTDSYRPAIFALIVFFLVGGYANLAGWELRTMLRQLLPLLPDMELAGPPQLVAGSLHVGGIKRLPVRFKRTRVSA